MDKREGILLVDKPQGWTANDVCQWVKRKFKIKKVGHAGTLDPNATGLLVLLLGKYTKLADRYLNDSKAYAGQIKLGVVTDSYDVDGTILEENPVSDISREQIQKVFDAFVPGYEQMPPMFSALKKDGVRLYKLARQGKEVMRPKRKVQIYELAIDAVAGSFVSFSMHVSKGFYVRSFAHDVGELLGCGAILHDLKRTRSGEFTLDRACSIKELEAMQSVDVLAVRILRTAPQGEK